MNDNTKAKIAQALGGVAAEPFASELADDIANAIGLDQLLDALRNLTGLAKMRGGHLHEYRAAIEDAEALIAKAESRS